MLEELVPPVRGARGRLVQAMRHAALDGGKRLRPFATVNSAKLFGVPPEGALRTAAAIELVHCYSLVHDDLPALDNSDLRHGKPTVHKLFDEATAVLAGDALLTLAFGVLVDPKTHPDLQVRAELVASLAASAGVDGLLGGQTLDMAPERASFGLEEIMELQALKSGALFRFACNAGPILGQADPKSRSAINAYAFDVGLAYQIADDLLDLEGSAEELGKPSGQDVQQSKATFPALLGIEGARQMAQSRVSDALGRLVDFGDTALSLRQLAQFSIDRRS